MSPAASRLGAGMVDWGAALRDCRFFHTSGIAFGWAAHSGYERNFLLGAFLEAMQAKPAGCRVGLDFNYRATLWSVELCREVMTPLVQQHVDVFVTTIEDMAKLYGIGCGQYSPEQIDKGDIGELRDEDLLAFCQEVCERFQVEIVAITIRYPDSFEQHRWESAAMHREGTFFRAPAGKPLTLGDRPGGGDTWNGGFYYGLLSGGFTAAGVQKGGVGGGGAARPRRHLNV